jgi:hypothetical protein
MGPDPENRLGDQDTGSPGRSFSSGLQVPSEPFLSWSGKDLSAPLYWKFKEGSTRSLSLVN